MPIDCQRTKVVGEFLGRRVCPSAVRPHSVRRGGVDVAMHVQYPAISCMVTHTGYVDVRFSELNFCG